MARPPYALIMLVAAALTRTALGQVSLAPEAGVLVLRNGQVLEGLVTRAGDYYVVTGEGSELRIKADEAEAFCASLEEAYEFKVAHLSGFSAKSHLELARWCLRHGLFERCAQQIDKAEQIEPGNMQVKDLRTRLALAAESEAPPPAAKEAFAVSVEDVEKTVRELPRGSVEKFGAVVQPILLNRCGANQCHGPNARSEFRLLRPPAGQIVSRRFTQRNLYEAVRYLNASNPEASPLVVMPQQRHGNSLSAVFDKHSTTQLAELVAWAKMTVAPSSRPALVAPASIAPPAATLSQAAAAVDNAVSSPPNAAVGVRVMRPAIDQPKTAPAVAPAQPPPPRDRFDPEIFNRHYHGK
jgi:hypothetical protein